MYYVYQIRIKGVIRYVGRTNDLDIREKQHNQLYIKGEKKPLYDYLRTFNYQSKLILEPIYTCKNKVESKRYEAFIILWYYFNVSRTQLLNKIPNVSDR